MRPALCPPRAAALVVLAAALVACPIRAAGAAAADPTPMRRPDADGRTVTLGGAADRLPVYDTPYYVIHTDLPAIEVREISLRMTRMAEEYHERTKEFSGAIRERMPFYVFSRDEDYHAAGGPKQSAGVAMGTRLMAIGGERVTRSTWHVIQHEGFHQFVRAAIGGDIPVWMNEGLAEYFGEAEFTGTGYIAGVIPPRRLLGVQAAITAREFATLERMMKITHEEWSKELTGENYDQAWTMVHFLAHGDGGRYQPLFVAFMRQVSGGKPWQRAWADTFRDTAGFEARWREWWLNLAPDATAEAFARVRVTALANFLARAWAQKQTFATWDEFAAAAARREIKVGDADWLPPDLLTRVLTNAERAGRWTLTPPPPGPAKRVQLTLDTVDKTRVTAEFLPRADGRAAPVEITVDALPRAIVDAKALAAAGKKPAARELLLDAIKKYPKSPALKDARQALTGL